MTNADTPDNDPKDESASGDEQLATMTFGEHLDELRQRLWVSLIAVFVVMAFFLFQHDRVMRFVMEPYDSMWLRKAEQWRERSLALTPAQISILPQYKQEARQFVLDNWGKIIAGERVEGVDLGFMLKGLGLKLQRNLISTTPLQDIVTFMIAALLCGLAVGSPIVLHQMWRFIAAGLYKNERTAIMKFLPASILLFLGGLAFGYYVMVPNALYFLYGLATTEFLLTIRDYFKFLFALTIALGAVFQLPVVMVGLTKFGITTPTTYTKYWRQTILVLFVVGALLTPPDPITQVLMAAPMMALYAAGIVLSRIVYKKKVEKQEASEGAAGE